MMMLASKLLLLVWIRHSFASLDLTAVNRRPRVAGLPDWTKVGFEQGQKPLPDDSLVTKTITAEQLASVYGVKPNDGVDDTAGLQKAISDNPGSNNTYTLIQLPAGTLNLASTIYLSSNYLILRGAGNDPSDGTVLSFSPDKNTVYDVLTKPNGDNWDMGNSITKWSYTEPGNTKSGKKQVTGSATGGWLWPGRSVFRVGSKSIAPKFSQPASLAAPNRVDIFYGSVNYHWRNDSSIEGYMADQRMEIAGFAGTRKVYIDTQNSSWTSHAGQDIWIAVPVRSYDYDSWQVQDQDYYQNEYMFQDWFTATGSGHDEQGDYIELDHDLEFDVYTNSVTGGSPQMQGKTFYTKIMPIEEPVHHVGIENLYMTQPMPSLSVANATHNYGNMAPEAAMHGIVFRYARDSWVRNIRTYMTGSHPIATEAARYLQIQDNYFDGAWNKGAGGNGYLRGSRVWDSLYYNNTLRNLRHFTFQWSAMRNVATMQNMTNDMNMHGGYEGHNLLELNYVSVPYEHRAGSCLNHCGGEGGSSENGTWAPIYWSTGSKASKWSGATGPQNVFYRNYMIKAFTAGSNQTEYQPYFAGDGSLSNYVWQFGWDDNSPMGSRYQHLSNDSSTLLVDWEGHEQDLFMADPSVGVNEYLTDEYTSLFLRDVTNGTQITAFSSIAGYTDCLGKVSPKVVGYYMGSAASRGCLPWDTDAIDTTTFTHIIYAYASLDSNGTVSLTDAQADQVKAIVKLKDSSPDLKVFIAVGGWGIGADASPLIDLAASNSSQTNFGTTALSLLTSLGADGIDIEWASCMNTSCISADDFSTIASAVKSELGSKLLSLSTPTAFWSLAGLNTTTTSLAKIVEFVSLITLEPSTTDDDANELSVIEATMKQAQAAGMPSTLLLFGVPFYSRPLGNSTLQSSCLASGDLAQGTFPYYAVDSIINNYQFDSDIYAVNLTTDENTQVQWLTMSDGSSMASDSPWSVSARALLSQNLCMGGVSVFSIDQDNSLGDLASGIYAPGGLLPKVDAIVASMSIESLDSSGYLRDGAYDEVAAQLASDYPFLNAHDTYHILLLAALQIQSQISNRLRLFLTESELASDGFNLYKTWEGKAANYNLANITGTGNKYWHCEALGKKVKCPGTIIEHSTIARPSPHLSKYDKVEWFLDDADGFKTYLNATNGVNLDDLVNGTFYVSRLDSSCGKKPPPCSREPPPEPLPLYPDITGQHRQSGSRRRSRHNSLHRGNGTGTLSKRVVNTCARDTVDPSDPYDPPESCRTEWFGLRLINPDTFFPNPVDTINNFVQSTDNSVTQFTDLAATLDPDPGPLMTLLETTLTAISLGNQTIANIIGYIQEVKHDQAVQKIADQAHARVSVLKIFENIGLVLLGFVPGVGEISDIVLGGWDTFSLISKAMDVASLAKTLDKDSEIFKILGIGLRAEEEVTGASEATEEAMSVEAVATRGKLGSSVTKAQDAVLKCTSSSFQAFAMDASKLGSILPSLARRSVHRRTHSTVLPKRRHISQRPLKRAPNAGPCLFKTQIASDLKIEGANHIKSCNSSSSQMAVPNDLTEPTNSSTMTFNQCFEQHAGLCQCDHLVEPDELLRYVKSAKLSPTDKKELCNILPNTRQDMAEILNADGNFAGLFGDDKAGGKFNPKSIKSTLLKNFKNPATLMNMYQKYSADGQNLMYNIVADHLTGSSDARAAIGDKLDAKLHDYFTEIDHSGTAAQKAAMAKIYVPDDPSIVKSTMGAFIKSGAANAIRIMRVFSNDTESAMPEEDPDDDSKNAGDTEEEKKSNPKPARTAAQDEACGGSGKKKAKIRSG